MSTIQQSHDDLVLEDSPTCKNLKNEVVIETNGNKEDEVLKIRESSNVSECSVVVEIVDLDSSSSSVETVSTTRACLVITKRDCRICHLSADSADKDSGFPIELGCSCKQDLAAAHKQCAEAWFKIRGNTTCEICGSIAQNVTGLPEHGSTNQWDEEDEVGNNNMSSTPLAESRNFWQGHRFLNFLLACMVFAFVISWLCHFDVPS